MLYILRYNYIFKKVKILEKNADYPSIRNPTNKKIKSKLGWVPHIDLKNGLLKLL